MPGRLEFLFQVADINNKLSINSPEGIFDVVAGEPAKATQFVFDAGHDGLNDGELRAQADGGEHEEEED